MLVTQMKDRGMAVTNVTPSLAQGQLRGYTQDNVPNLQVAIKARAKNIVLDPKNTRKVPPQLLVYIIDDPKAYDDLKRFTMNELPVPVVSQVLLGRLSLPRSFLFSTLVLNFAAAKNRLKDRGVD